jgi:hypothetical protein
MSHIYPLLPRLTVNRQFMSDFLAAESPCFALGMVEEHGRQRGFMALRPDATIPEAVTSGGFRFGHSLFGNAAYEVVHFAFEFYGFSTYNVLVNPNNPLVRTVLATMVESGDYFFFAISEDGHTTAFRSGLGQANLAGLSDHLPRIQRSATTDSQYRNAVAAFARNPQPPGVLLDWVCRDSLDYLDPAADRLELAPA